MNVYHFQLVIRCSIPEMKEFRENLPRTRLEENSYTFQMEHYIPVGGNLRNPDAATVAKRRVRWGTTTDISVQGIRFRAHISSPYIECVIEGSTNANPPVTFLKEFGKMHPHLHINLSFLSYGNNSAGYTIIERGIVKLYKHRQGDDILFEQVEHLIRNMPF